MRRWFVSYTLGMIVGAVLFLCDEFTIEVQLVSKIKRLTARVLVK
ncbi:hypothetical protein LAP8965_01467 [Lactiplantibacillus plantarum]|nr:hypothetical protein LAP8963_01426 [Lactiplantibacillus plantarum]SPE13286.1 hypothetical protein LAP8964_02667 [Lactiplantibacillus plantarum]SPH06180.1 hypothetical protein LAP8965_01467 [Lactiplantibacillus plantarum]SPH09323.1 hypothetical protein LAP8966_01466 [Lactiplantibacillus plantarum]